MASAGGGPDKRTTAYENIFGRPTAKPKGPVAQPPPLGHPPAHAAYPYAQQPHLGQYPQPQQGSWQQQRWNAPAPGPPMMGSVAQGGHNLNGHTPYPMGGGYYRPNNSYSYDQVDRRSSVTPSFASQSTSSSGYPATPYTRSNTTAESSYGGVKGPTPASAYASFHSNEGHADARYSAPSPAPSQPYMNRGSMQSDGYPASRPSISSSAADSSYGPEPTGGSSNGAASADGSVTSLPAALSPRYQPPRLPSFELDGAGKGVEEANWFKGMSLEGSAASSSGGHQSSNGAASLELGATSSRDAGFLVPQNRNSLPGNGPYEHQEEEDNFATPGPTDGRDPFATEFETFQQESARRDQTHSQPHDSNQRQTGQHPQQVAPGSSSTASSLFDGNSSTRRKMSFESDRHSIANSIYTLPGGLGNGGQQSGIYSGGGRHASSTSNFGNASGVGGFTPMTQASAGAGASDMWQRLPRTRTASSATQAAQAAYSPGLADSRSRLDHRSMSVGVNSSRPSMPSAPVSHNSSISGSATAVAQGTASGANSTVGVPAGSTSHKKGPLVYPALLSRVAESFQQRVSVAERVKDGLTYKDAFDGREAVDRIAYIIKTTDRNLALLLGRALDAQKFFHDVTYDHRLRDSPNELYQFRVRLASPFGSEQEHFDDGVKGPGSQLQVPGLLPHRENSTLSLPASAASSIKDGRGSHLAPMAIMQDGATTEDDDELPTGVFTLLTDCYSPTCTRDRLCYSIACPRRLEQQARLNMKPQLILKRSISKESLGDVKQTGALWAESVSKEVLESVSEQERKRQELINEVAYTERDFVRDIEYLRDFWIKPLRSKDIIAEARREDFVTQVFWNVLEVHAVNSKLAELITKRQKQHAVVDRIGDIFLEMVPHFQPFVKYGAHQLYGKYEFEKEKSSNPAFAKFVDETERLPESRKLELNGYLTKPTTRLARYPLLLDAVIKASPDDSPDKVALPKVIKIVKEFLTKVNVETGKSENRFNLAQLDQQLFFKQGEAVDLRLRDEQRELVFKGPLKKRGGSQSENAELQVFLFDHALLMVKAKTVQKNELYKVFRKPIPLELLIVTVYDEVPTGKGSATRPKSVMSKTSTGNRLSGGVPSGSAPKQDAKTGYALTFTYLGRKGYSLTLWASTFVGRRKWFEHIEARQEILRQRSNIFDTITLSEGFFVGANRVNCSVPFDFGRRIIYGTDDGVYLSDLREKARPPTKVLPLPGVTQIDVLEEYQILIILAERSVHTFTLDALDPSDPMGSLKRGRRISSHTSFFKAGHCLGRTLVCVVKSSSLSSTIKTLEPIEQNIRGKKQPTFRKLLQGGQETLRVFKEFYIPTESSSIHFLKTKLCVGCTKGFEIVDLETLDTQGLLDPADSSLDFVHRKETVKPLAIYRIDREFLLCYDEFAFYVNRNGWRAKGNWIIHWEGNPVSFALHHPYVLAFEPSFIEVRHVETGALHQVITGYNLRCLFADVPPPVPSGQSAAAASAAIMPMNAQYDPTRVAGYPGPGPRPPAAHGPYGGYNGGAAGTSGNGGMPPGALTGPGMPVYSQQSAMYGRPPGAPRTNTGMPYAYNQPPPPRPPPQRNPVWESVAASRNQIVFIGDAAVFAIRMAGVPAS
ncbi:unnamed protein product [Parajaminaea phylloscopi]